MNKPVATFDADGVIVDWFTPALKYINLRLGTNVQYDEVFDHNIALVFGISEAAVQNVVDDWYATRSLERLEPIEGAIETLHNIEHHYRIAVITSRRDAQRTVTRAWFERYLPGVPIIFSQGAANPYAGGSGRRTKYELARQLGSIFHVEDNPAEFENWPADHIKPICYRQPFNRNVSVPRMTWSQIETFAMELFKARP